MTLSDNYRYSNRLLLVLGLFFVGILLGACNRNSAVRTQPHNLGVDLPARVVMHFPASAKKNPIHFHIDHLRKRIYSSTILPYGFSVDSAYLQMILSTDIETRIVNEATKYDKVWSVTDTAKISIKGGNLKLVIKKKDHDQITYDLRLLTYGYDPYKFSITKISDRLPATLTESKAFEFLQKHYLLGRGVDKAVALWEIVSTTPFEFKRVEAILPTDIDFENIVVSDSEVYARTTTGALFVSKDLKQWSAIDLKGIGPVDALITATIDRGVLIVADVEGGHRFVKVNDTKIMPLSLIPSGFPIEGAIAIPYQVDGYRMVNLYGSVDQGKHPEQMFFSSDGVNWGVLPLDKKVSAEIPVSSATVLSSLITPNKIYLLGGRYVSKEKKQFLQISLNRGFSWQPIAIDGAIPFQQSPIAPAALLREENKQEILYFLGAGKGVTSDQIYKVWVDDRQGIVNAFEE